MSIATRIILDRAKDTRSLLEIALDVHTSNTGSYERSDEDQAWDVNVLRCAIDTWEPSPSPKWAAFDDAVKALIERALEEAGS